MLKHLHLNICEKTESDETDEKETDTVTFHISYFFHTRKLKKGKSHFTPYSSDRKPDFLNSDSDWLPMDDITSSQNSRIILSNDLHISLNSAVAQVAI